jgi:hypothetical protein
VAHAQIAFFARLAKGGDSPKRVIYGQATKLSRTMHAIRYDESRDEFYVTNPFAQAILAFRGGADGQEAPLRIIQGPHTRLENPDTLEIDPVNNEIAVPQKDDILFYPLTANGDVAPARMFHGGRKNGWTTATGGIAIDPIHNVVVVAGTILTDANVWHSPYGDNRESLIILERTGNGDVKPLRVIRGPQTGMHAIRQMRIEPESGWIVITQMTSGEIPAPQGTYVGVYSINDSGDVPPRWEIEGKPSNDMKKPHGIALDPRHKEVVIADMRMNAILTFYFPEIF